MNDLKFHKDRFFIPDSLPTRTLQPLAPAPLTYSDLYEHRISNSLNNQLFYWRNKHQELNQKMASLKDNAEGKQEKSLIMLHKKQLDDHFKLLSIIIENIEKSTTIITSNIR